jgi:hypothetical protein
MTAAAGTTLQKGGTFAGITALMGPITTLTEETSGSSGCVVAYGTLWCSGWSLWSCGMLEVLVRWTGFSGQAPSLTSEAGYRP